MGVVYEARHASLGTRVALKVVDAARLQGSHARERFLREAWAIEKVVHPHVVRVLGAELDAEPPFIVMEFLEGETLQAVLQREGRLALERALRIFLPILSAVAAIHDAGILHRDLKTGNVMLARDDSGVRPVVLDFGIARLAEDDRDETLTHSEALLGTPRYLSPEQMLNAKAASALSDQYALGVMLYECLTGVRPFSGGSHYELMHAVLHAVVPAPSEHVSDLPAGLDEVILRAMSRDAALRFVSVRAFAEALLEFADAATHARWQGARAVEVEDRTEVDRRTSLRSPTPASLSPEPRGEKRRLGPYLVAFAVALVVPFVVARLAELGGAKLSASPERREPAPAANTAVPSTALLASPAPPVTSAVEAPLGLTQAALRRDAAPAAPLERGAPASSVRRLGMHPRPAASARSFRAIAPPRVNAGKPKRDGLDELGKDDAVDPFAAATP
jgi:serine/threonine-protein kinase